MKKIKYLVLIIIVLLFTGCSGNYNLNFNNDLSVSEELEVFIDNTSDNYERTLSLFDKANIDEDDYEVNAVSDEVKITYKKDYSSFEEYYLDSILYKILFRDMSYTKNNIGMNINAKSILKLDDTDNQNIINSYDIDDFKINIKVPFIVKKNNADIVKEDTYTWTLDNDDTYKEIELDYSYKKTGISSIVMLVLIGIASIFIIGYVVNTIIKNRRI